MVSVVIAVFNGEATLGAQLEALTQQTYPGDWEVIVSDNGSTDRSLDVVRSFADRLPGLQIVDASDRRGQCHARNMGARIARGEFIGFTDQDDVVSPGWIGALAEALEDSDMVGGRLETHLLNEPGILAWRDHPHDGLRTSLGFLPYAEGTNCAVRASVLQDLGGWREDFYGGGEDVDLSWRVQLSSYRFGYAPDAVVHYRYRSDLRGTARQAYGYGISHTHIYRLYRGRGVGKPKTLRGLKAWAKLLVRVGDLLHEEGRGSWVFSAGIRIGHLSGSLRHRVFML
jgi:GT2 family glycosyltransferase